MRHTIPELPQHLFDWSRWRAGSIHEFVPRCRRALLMAVRDQLREAAVGWAPADDLLCRPKSGQVGVMFFKNGRHFWCHLRRTEVEELFNEAE